jgi:hypothetical protein
MMAATEHTRSALSRYDCAWINRVPKFESKVVGDLVDHWRGLFEAGGGQIPYRRDIDPMIIGTTLSRVYIYEKDDEGFICRLAGEQISWNFDTRLKDQRLSDILEPPIHEMVDLFMSFCLQEPAIYRNHGLLYSDKRKRKVTGEHVFLPLRGEAGELTYIIGLTDVTSLGDAPMVPTRAFHPCAAMSSSTNRTTGSMSSGAPI